jgi:hypothetical protein
LVNKTSYLTPCFPLSVKRRGGTKGERFINLLLNSYLLIYSFYR